MHAFLHTPCGAKETMCIAKDAYYRYNQIVKDHLDLLSRPFSASNEQKQCP